jgi:cytochrome c oxidase accessory protein FixG
MHHAPGAHWTAFLWAIGITGLLYFDYAWFREQTCLIICPYGRFQSALIDTDTIIIGYDTNRGEPRSKKTAVEGGHCIDCRRCVVVCPTGIDIRNGLQLECIGCANCIDACDEIMDKLERPRGLIRYDSRRGFHEGARRSLVRPRILVYVLLAAAGLSVATVAMLRRSDFEVHVLRSRGLPYELIGEDVRNVYSLRVQNKRDDARVYGIASASANPSALSGLEAVVSQPSVRIAGLSDAQVPIILTAPKAAVRENVRLSFTVTDSLSRESRSVDVIFRGPG